MAGPMKADPDAAITQMEVDDDGEVVAYRIMYSPEDWGQTWQELKAERAKRGEKLRKRREEKRRRAGAARLKRERLRKDPNDYWYRERRVVRLSREEMADILVECHPLDGELYTPVTEELLEFLDRLKLGYGTWRLVAAIGGMRTRALRKIRAGRAKSVSMTVWDRFLVGTGNEWMMEQFLWFTAEDLVRLGVWEPVVVMSGYAKLVGPSYRRRGVGRGNRGRQKRTSIAA